MTKIAAIGALLGVPLAADLTETNLLTLVMVAMTSGLVVRLLTLRTDRKATEAKTEATDVSRQHELDTMQAAVLSNVREELRAMAQKLDLAKTELSIARAELADARRIGAERALKNELLERGMEQLHDEVAALRAQVGLGGRRADDPPIS
jgi:Tfp pilus assembly protein PilO